MNNKFTVDNAAMLLIDHQRGTLHLSRNRAHDEILRNTRALARTAVETAMPLVFTTSMENHFQGLLLDDLRTIAPAAYEQRVKRPGVVDCWEYPDFKTAALASGRKKFILAGLTNDVCIVYPAISAVQEGYEVQVVVDAGGSPSQAADDAAVRRMERHGVVVTSTNQMLAELASSWSEGPGLAIQRILYEEIPSHLIPSP